MPMRSDHQQPSVGDATSTTVVSPAQCHDVVADASDGTPTRARAREDIAFGILNVIRVSSSAQGWAPLRRPSGGSGGWGVVDVP